MPSKSKSCAASGNLDVNVKLSKSGRTTNFHLPPNKTIEDVCKQVADEEKVSAKQIIIKYTGKILNRFHTLSFLGVRPETVLKAEVVTVEKYNIYVQKENGETFPMCIENISTIQEVKSMLAERLEVGLSNSVEIELKGKKIIGKESQSAISLGLDDEALVKVKVVKRPEAAASNNVEEEDEQLDEATLQELLSSFVVEAGNNVEVVFSFDTTGSMSACLDQVRSKVEETTSRLLRDIPNIRIGIMAHGDYCDQSTYVLRTCDLTDSRRKLIRFINDVPSTGGGDSPECYEWVLKKAQELSWTEGSARALVMIGDDVPHPPSYTDQHINWHTELDRLRDMNIKVYGVQAMHGSTSNLFYEELAERTAGTYLKFTQFSYITDMFLAVCYRESSDEKLQAYCEEVKNDGRMTEELSSMFVKLEEKPTAPPVESNNERYVARPWWDPSLDNGQPQYTYDEAKDKWSTFESESCYTSSVAPNNGRKFLSFRRSKRSNTRASGSKSKGMCGIM
ncbi:uncharacterized protein LOC117102761 [Anneissia japonica]|uniref:uncharacterized protein LOC117102761 n=1 Tax=Anneissia japonica TaxID=1529436 RepID=UPI0014255BB1|nr:uncharacterized protein LOC117102761 [Anneissia japonica]